METIEIKRKMSNATDDPAEKTWRSLFIITGHWQSDLDFFSDELEFLRSLVDKYFLWLVEGEDVAKAGNITLKLSKLSKRRLALQMKMSVHLNELTNLLENPFPYDAHLIEANHAGLEVNMSKFTMLFREIKKQVFRFTERILRSAKLKHFTEDVAMNHRQENKAV